jgi:hypothetical protein
MTIDIVKYIQKYLRDYKNSHSFVSGLIITVTGKRKSDLMPDTGT